jgi:hypothetical protein
MLRVYGLSQGLVISILSIVIPSLSAILSVTYATYRMGKKFSAIEERFKIIDEKFNRIDEMFESLKLYIDTRFNQIDERFNKLKEYIDMRIVRLGRAFSSYQEFFIEYLSVKGVVSEQEATMIKNEASRILSLATSNPFTKEEWEKLKRYLEKDLKEFTLKEAEEFRELGRKAIAKYWDRPEAYKLQKYMKRRRRRNKDNRVSSKICIYIP